jgi:uncharacterized protein (TIGR02246 family)
MESKATRRSEDVEAIRSLVGPEWAAAWAAGDASVIAEFYTEDAVLLPQNQLPIIGKTAIRSGYETFLKQYSVRGSSEIVELEVGGDWAFMRGTYTTTVIPKKGGPPIEEDRGNWLWIVKRQTDGLWKIFRAIGASEPLSGEDDRDAPR